MEFLQFFTTRSDTALFCRLLLVIVVKIGEGIPPTVVEHFFTVDGRRRGLSYLIIHPSMMIGAFFLLLLMV